MKAHDLKYSDTGFHSVLQGLLQSHAVNLGVGKKRMADLCAISIATLWRCYGGTDAAFNSFFVLFGLCDGHEMDLTLHIGEAENPNRNVYTIKYSGNFVKFKYEIGAVLLKARSDREVSSLNKDRLNGASPAQIWKIENAYPAEDVKPKTIHGIFKALNAELILEICIQTEEQRNESRSKEERISLATY